MITLLSRLAIALSATFAICSLARPLAANEICCESSGGVLVSTPEIYDVEPVAPSWVFKRSTFTHDPMTGARVAQYMRKPPIEPLDDQRAVTSSYRRTRTVNRGRDGSIDTSYQVQAWGNGRGGIDAEWQMFHDAWKESILSGSYYNSNTQSGPWNSNGPIWNGNWQGNNGWNNGWSGPPNNWNGGWKGPWKGSHHQHGTHDDKNHWPSDNRAPLPHD